MKEDNFKDIKNLPTDLDALFCKLFEGNFGWLTCHIYDSGHLNTTLYNFFVGDKITNVEQCKATIKSMKATLQRTNNVQEDIQDILKTNITQISKLDTVKDIDDMQNFKKDEFIKMMENLKQSCKDYQDTVEEKKNEVKDLDNVIEQRNIKREKVINYGANWFYLEFVDPFLSNTNTNVV